MNRQIVLEKKSQIPPKKRLEFLDALRGIAAMAVLLQHSAELLWPAYKEFSHVIIRPGAWGVFVFFMLSGFVIPLSLKREKSAISFWIGRAFRLFPIYWFVLFGALAFNKMGLYPTSAAFNSEVPRNFIVNLTMVQEFLGTPHIIGAAWSLAYEIVFYTFITMLLLTGLTKTASKSTIMCLVGSASLGLLIHPTFVTNPQSLNKSMIIPLALAVGCLAMLWSKANGWLNKVLLIAFTFATVGLILNQPRDLWFSLLLFATMGCGWVYNEAYQKRISELTAYGLSAATIVLSSIQFYWWANPETRRADVLTIMAAHAVFAVAYNLKDLSYPKVLTWLGKISYSIYLIHAVAIHSVPRIENQPVLTMGLWVGTTLLVSHITYKLIEEPSQKLGKKLRGRWNKFSSKNDLEIPAEEINLNSTTTVSSSKDPTLMVK